MLDFWTKEFRQCSPVVYLDASLLFQMYVKVVQVNYSYTVVDSE